MTPGLAQLREAGHEAEAADVLDEGAISDEGRARLQEIAARREDGGRTRWHARRADGHWDGRRSAMTAKIGRVAIYARVSTRDHGQDPELQLVPLREWAAAHGGRITEYVDLASAADLRGRTAWRRLLDDARHHRLDTVAVWKLDRAFRSSLEAASTLEELHRLGVDFASITQDIDTTTPAGKLLFSILAAVAEMERDLIVERVREGMKNAQRKGARIGRPSGIERAAFARQWPAVRAELAAGRLSHRAAATHLRIGHATLERLLREADEGPDGARQRGVA